MVRPLPQLYVNSLQVVIVATPEHGQVCFFLLSKLFANISIVLNMHEIAITSGFAAAYRLGADFPHLGDEGGARLFRLYFGLSHAARLVNPFCFTDRPLSHITLTRKKDRKGRLV